MTSNRVLEKRKALGLDFTLCWLCTRLQTFYAYRLYDDNMILVVHDSYEWLVQL
jgi:hypothetical protein